MGYEEEDNVRVVAELLIPSKEFAPDDDGFVPLGGGDDNVRFIQVVTEARRDIYYSDLKKENIEKTVSIPLEGVVFPVLDTEPPADTPETVFYPSSFDGGDSYSMEDKPFQEHPIAGEGKKFDKMVWENKFTTYVVYKIGGETVVLPLGSISWEINFLPDTVWNDKDDDGQEDPGERALVEDDLILTQEGTFETGIDGPGRIVAPVAKEILKPVPLD